MRRTLPLFKWASPRSFKLLRVKVPKSNSVVASVMVNTKQRNKASETETDTIMSEILLERDNITLLVDGHYNIINSCVLCLVCWSVVERKRFNSQALKER